MLRHVMSLHGIRTRGVWQKDLVPILARHGFIPYALDYGSFSVFKFASRRSRQRKLEWLRDEYERIVGEAGAKRPSVVAHSFGSYLVAGLLEKYHELRFDKVILAGSIVREDFDWPAVLSAGRVNFVHNDYGALDVWPRMARVLVRDSGASGTKGFTKTHAALSFRKFDRHGHSDYFHRNHFMEYWIPTLTRITVSETERRGLTEILDVTCQAVANRLAVNVDLVRSNIFVADQKQQLYIPEGLTHNIPNPDERTVVMTSGVGCAGTAFKARAQTMAIMKTNWGVHTLPSTELAKVDKRVKWIGATPIPDPDVPGAVIGVMGVDGLVVPKDQNDLAPLLGDLLVMAERVALKFKELA